MLPSATWQKNDKAKPMSSVIFIQTIKQDSPVTISSEHFLLIDAFYLVTHLIVGAYVFRRVGEEME